MAALYQTILVPLDGSEFAASALPHAQELARRFDAQLVLFQAIQVAPAYVAAGRPGYSLAVDIGPDDEAMGRELEAAKRNLEHFAGALRKQGLRVRTATQVGPAADCIVDYAAAEKIDLIVMSTHGRTGLARWAFGSVAAKVIQVAACPVLTIRPAAK